MSCRVTEKGFTVGIRIRIRNPEAEELETSLNISFNKPTVHWVIP